MNKALFLDRDGVINKDLGYVHKIEDVDFIDGIFELVEKAKLNKYLVVVVTNQAGIGHGYYTEKDFDQLMSWMCLVFQSRKGKIDRVYKSPFHPSAKLAKYRLAECTRKPGPGMLLRAASELQIDLGRSIMVGDNETDIMAGNAAGVGKCFFYSKVDCSDSLLSHVRVHKLDQITRYIKSLGVSD